MKFLEHFEKKDPEIVRKYISDSSFTKAIIEEVEMRSEKKPVFAFNVTMQNHASYAEEYDNLKKDVKITDEKKADHTDELETYLSLLKKFTQSQAGIIVVPRTLKTWSIQHMKDVNSFLENNREHMEKRNIFIKDPIKPLKHIFSFYLVTDWLRTNP